MAARRDQSARIPPRWFLRIGWAVHNGLYRLSGGRLGLQEPGEGRFGILRLRTVGRRSGQERVVMLFCLNDGPNFAVVASNAGEDEAPRWWLNLQAAGSADVDLPAGPRAVKARVADAAEQERIWPRFVAIDGRYAAYTARTERPIPVVILEPAADNQGGSGGHA